ncbi:MAG: septum formation protein Maf [Calditrichaeota bacterium]|nr:MAG: septum formation protein Maf [Calditrichota bacterium]
MFKNKKFVLASGSPRRKQLFTMLGLEFIIDPPEIEEHFDPKLAPVDLAKSLARQKGKLVCEKYKQAIVVAADTIVVVDGKVLGKPKDAVDAFSLLKQLSGREHEVITGVYMYWAANQKTVEFAENTTVLFKELSDEEISNYIATDAPLDKAGAYGIQDISAVFVTKINGCFYNVVGFPVAAFYQRCMQLFGAVQDK